MRSFRRHDRSGKYPASLGAQLEIIRLRAAAVIVEECPRAPHATGHEARTFAEIICDLAAIDSVLPVRFPTVLTTRSAVLAELQATRGRMASDGLASSRFG